MRAISRHRIKRIGERYDLRANRYLLVRQPIGIATSIETLVMMFRHERYVGIWMTDGREDLVAGVRMSIQLARALCVDVVRRVDDVAIHDQKDEVLHFEARLIINVCATRKRLKESL